jgi:hypothetical protein
MQGEFMTSFKAQHKDTLAFIFRLLALLALWILAGINISLLPLLIERVSLGTVQDISIRSDSTENETYVIYASEQAVQAGVAEGDHILNPQANTQDQIGTPVTFLVKSKSDPNAPVRQVTFIRKALFPRDYIGTLFVELSPQANLRLETILLLSAVCLIGLLGLLAFLRNGDVLTLFLFVVAFSFLFAHLLGLQWILLNQILPSAIIFFMIYFPNGKLAPRWSALLILLPLPNTIFTVFIQRGQLTWTPFVNSAYNFMVEFLPAFILIMLWVVVYRSQRSLSSMEKRRINWIFAGVSLIFIPFQVWSFLSMGLLKEIYYLFNTAELVNRGSMLYGAMHHPGPIIILAVAALVIYRYLYIFTSVERQQIKWFFVGLILSGTGFVILYMFLVYYHHSYEIFYRVAYQRYLLHSYHQGESFTAQIMDGYAPLALIVIVLSMLPAILRTRLDDVDTVLERVLIYCGMILYASVLSLCMLMFVNYTLGDIPRGQKAFLIILLSTVLFVVTFKSTHFYLQKFVGTFLAPEGSNLAEIFPEFNPERPMSFSLSELSRILTERSMQQWKVASASVFIKNKDGQLQHLHTASMEKRIPKPVIKTRAISELKKGELVLPDLSSPYSLLVPLVQARGRKSDFVGALMLGPRLNEFGYSSEIKKRLKAFGEQVGKTLYIAQVRKFK